VDALLSTSLGDALVARLSTLAGVDPWAVDRKLGHLRVRTEAAVGEFLLLVHESSGHLAGELRRIVLPRVTGATRPLGMPPDRLGAYRLEGELGRGGMGVVYRGRHVRSDRPVALKILHKEIAADPQLAAQFIREGRAASFAKHAGIVDVTDFGRLPDGRAYLVMELVDAPTLEQAMGGKPIEPLRAVLIARKIAAALEAAHVRGVVHRDLKPANVFLDPDDNVKLGDFGAAKVVSSTEGSNTQLGVLVGTPFYMAPEHARGRETDERTDIYALGCILFEMVAGTVPFKGATVMEVLIQHHSAPPPPLTSPLGPVPPELEAAVHRALAKRPEERHQNPAELTADLARALAALQPPPGGGARA
jgi:serine/threonine-protein kinase